MIDRSAFLRVPGADPERWARRWGLEIVTAPCQECGAERRTDVPIAGGTLRGLESSPCKACGDASGVPYCVRPTSGGMWEHLLREAAQRAPARPRKKRTPKPRRRLRLLPRPEP
jgi:hypothetical protein